MQCQEEAISSRINNESIAIIKRNREILESIAKTIHFCGKQGISLRGHRDDSSASLECNPGNFIELLRYRAETGDACLRKYLESSPRIATYTSKTIQNQLINILGDDIRSNIINEVKAAKFFSILCDEVTDVSCQEQLSLVLRFVDQSNTIREKFVDFVEVERITGTVLAQTIMDKLSSYGLEIENCRGQGYDGASNMSSAVRGVQGIICASSPKAFYVHCNAHVLNLAIVKACNLPVIRNMASTITETANFFNYSPNRQRLLERVIAVKHPESRKHKLQDLCRTRWIQRHEAYEVFGELYPSTVEALDILQHEHANKETYGR